MSTSEPLNTVTASPLAGRFGGMTGFSLVWIGQVVSLLGTSMTQFALVLWAWQTTGKATTLSLMAALTFGPALVLGPVAGALVDRWNRKRVMMVADSAAGVVTLGLLALLVADRLEIVHLYLAGALFGMLEVFQFPASSAAITMMLSKRHYARASGMLYMARSLAQIAGPLLAGTLIAFIHTSGILLVDVMTFLFAVTLLLWVAVPQPPAAEEQESLGRDSIFGFRYILRHRHLLALQLLYSVYNSIANFAFVLLPALILARTGDDELKLGAVLSALGVGGLVGALLLSFWGGPKRRVYGVLVGILAESLGLVLFGLGESLGVWMVAAFLRMLALPVVSGCNQAIWQAKVPPAIQGRVFAARRLIAHLPVPLAMLAAGPFADRLFEPALRTGAPAAETFGWLVGTGPGAGIGLMFLLAGILGAAVVVSGFALPRIRNVETLSPDHSGTAG